MGLEYVDLRDIEVDLSLLQNFPHKLIHRQSLFPIRRDNGQLVVATSDPFDLYPLDEVSAATGLSVMPVLAVGTRSALIKRHLGVGSETVDGLMAQADDRDGRAARRDRNGRFRTLRDGAGGVGRPAGERDSAGGDRDAGERRAHRIAGSGAASSATASTAMLHPQPVPPEINRFQAAIISRLKIMARLNIAEKRLPQDGRIKLKVGAAKSTSACRSSR